MPEEPEIETKDLQEQIEEMHEEKTERDAEVKRSGWTKYVGLSTAILAVFAAVGALQSGALVNEALINQVKASDTWNEYESARQKDHLYTITINSLLDSNRPGVLSSPPTALTNQLQSGSTKTTSKQIWSPKAPSDRAKQYEGEVKKERTKEDDRMKRAKKLELESAHEIHKHHQFAYSVALIQVAIALGAVSALTRVKSVWGLSLVSGLVGVVFFFFGFLR